MTLLAVVTAFATIVVVEPGTIEVDAAFLTAIGGIIVAITGLLTAIGAFMVIIRREVNKVHTLVNSHASDQAQRIGQLGAALQAAGIQIPPLVPASATGIPKSKHPPPPVDPNVPDVGPMELTGTVTGTVEPTKKEGT